MAVLSPVQTFWATGVAAIAATARLVLTWRDGNAGGDAGGAAGGAADTPVLTIHNAALGLSASMDLTTAAPVAAGAITSRATASSAFNTALDLDGAARSIGLVPLAGLATAAADAAGAAASQTLWLDRSAFSGNAVTALREGDLLVLSARGGSGLTSYQIGADGRPARLQALADTERLPLEAISAMASLQTAGGTYLITASETRDTLSVLRIGAGGSLTPLATIGPQSLLPVSAPSQLAAVTLAGQHFVLLGSAGSSSLSVLRLDDSGSLTCTDHLLDSRDTRFGGLSALGLLQLDGQVLVAAAGNDGGVSLLQLLPSGRLLLRDTLIDASDTALQNITELRLLRIGDRVELLALSAADRGVTRIAVDVSGLAGGPGGLVGGVVGVRADGTAGNDILTADPGGTLLRAGAGNDILISGAGLDRLDGGAGADIFLMLPDAGGRDLILNFDPAQDRIDLSAFPRLHGPAGMRILSTEAGGRLGIGATEITVTAGRRLTVEELRDAILFNADRVLQTGPAPVSQAEPPADLADSFFWISGARIYDGGGGQDRISYAAAPAGVVIDLGVQGLNAGSAAGHVLRSIEIVEGSALADRLAGDAGSNTLIGGPGDDVLEGRGGADWLEGGPGADRLEGGAGTDMASFITAARGLTIDLGAGTARESAAAGASAETDRLSGIENITASGLADLITGDAGANLLRAMAGDDWILASGGGDTLDGGAGRDMVSYVNSPGRVVVDLAAGQGREGMALGDSYISIERITGSVHADLIIGSPGEDEVRGLGGYDWFVGSAGADRFDGGTGRDTVAYSTATAGVAASLLAGRGTTGTAAGTAAGGQAAGGQAAGDLYTAIESLTGSSLADSLTGDHGPNILRGLAGDDLIFGLDGNDTLDGSFGADTLSGGAGNDRLTGGGGNDRLEGGVGWDYAFYAGRRADYSIAGTAVSASVTGSGAGSGAGSGDGADRLTGIEVLVFSDGTLFL